MAAPGRGTALFPPPPPVPQPVRPVPASLPPLPHAAVPPPPTPANTTSRAPPPGNTGGRGLGAPQRQRQPDAARAHHREQHFDFRTTRQQPRQHSDGGPQQAWPEATLPLAPAGHQQPDRLDGGPQQAWLEATLPLAPAGHQQPDRLEAEQRPLPRHVGDGAPPQIEFEPLSTVGEFLFQTNPPHVPLEHYPPMQPVLQILSDCASSNTMAFPGEELVRVPRKPPPPFFFFLGPFFFLLLFSFFWVGRHTSSLLASPQPPHMRHRGCCTRAVLGCWLCGPAVRQAMGPGLGGHPGRGTAPVPCPHPPTPLLSSSCHAIVSQADVLALKS